MLTFNGNLKVYVALEPCDMRKSFHGLSAMVRNHLDLDPLTAWILNQIACIYRIEAALREQGAGQLERQKARWLETRRHYNRLGRLIVYLRTQRDITPGSLLGKALAYAAGQCPHLEPCFLDGQIEFDNNLTENAIRPTKLGMKNWMFIGREETGWRSAVIYTFVEQVRRHGKDPFAYFEWVFGKLMHDPPQKICRTCCPPHG
jgi:hypothetical protein